MEARRHSSMSSSFFSRPWQDLYNVSVRVPSSLTNDAKCDFINAEDVDDDEHNKSKILVMLHVDAIYEVFKRLSPRDLVRVSTVCKKWHAIVQHSTKSLWQSHCERAFRFFDVNGEETRQRCAEAYSNNYKKMFYERNRIRTDGLYVSRNTYVKA